MNSIWIDLDNAPHVPFFKPLIGELVRRGHEVSITVRDYGYTRDLLDQCRFDYTPVGRHPGKNRGMKVLGLSARVMALAFWARRREIKVAVSHGSRAQVLAASLLKIPCVSMYDYEFVSTGIFHRLSDKILLPDLLPDEMLASRGLPSGKVKKYPGLKEEVYLGDFRPELSILKDLHVGSEQILATLRPPATAAHYHNPESEAIFAEVLDRIAGEEQVLGVVVPRTEKQGDEYRKKLKSVPNFCILDHAVDGLNLIWQSDLVVGGGGTMNREAALLGVPVYSVFMGHLGAIDSVLVGQGRMRLVQSVSDVMSIKFQRRKKPDFIRQSGNLQERSGRLVEFVVNEIISAVNE
ncbi:MAG: hypothetical protein CME25_03175 [Gemmatimonadetes bacterium]|nr:hypothetical protein [Gemmatimonadota bacterium]|tara:strand:- start:19364 stop:20416 length:1053 start_codon:yes stop_codon:yes gene_type:complete